MYLVPQRQLDRLKNYETPPTLRQTAENELDTSMKNVLSRSDMDQHDKVELYTGLLQRYLSLIKQGSLETNTLTLSVPQTPENRTPAKPLTTHATSSSLNDDALVVEILKNIPQRSKKNAQYILDKMLNSQDTATWSETGEFVFNGLIVPGTHIFDLVKSATAPQTIRRRPQGWREFLSAIATLNIPLSTVPNKQVQQAVESLKRTGPYSYSTPIRGLEPTEFVSPLEDTANWLSY